MKTPRSLLWGTAVGAVALTLVHGTASVRADNIASSPLAAAYDGSGTTVKPYFWTELAHSATSWGLAYFGTLAPPNDPYLAASGGTTSSAASPALFSRALD